MDASLEALVVRSQLFEVFLELSVQYKDRIRAFFLRLNISLLGLGGKLYRGDELVALSGQVEHWEMDDIDCLNSL